MADFIESEAEESEEEEGLEINEEEGLEINERKKFKRAKQMEDSSEEEEDDDGEEVKDLIDDTPIQESEGEESDASGGQKRKKSDDENYDSQLEDEDYDLIEENLGVKVERRKKFRRLRRIQDEESDNEEATDDSQGKEAIAAEIFSEDERDDIQDDERRSERSHRPIVEPEQFHEEEEDMEYSDEDDFIVDDEGRPIGEKKRRKPIFTDAALQEAQETFGVDFDYEDFTKYDEEYDEEDEEEEDEYVEDEEDTERRRRPKKSQRKKPSRKTIFEIYEPDELKRNYFTDLDNEVRNTDIPERMQLREVPITPVPEDSNELSEEAEWIYKQAFCKPTVSIQDAHLTAEARERQKKGPQTVGKIKKALEFMRNQQLEVPFIAFYRKEYVQPELNINDLWKIYKYDAKWCQLKTRKQNLLSLFEKMRTYQIDQIMKNPDAPILKRCALIKSIR
ncbi:Acidic N-terminal SPT6 [Popillia japonica]|uniref:Acidic N-terminal SPT6 n=1 Tax=Popillia japonica TaxID=7064 RepID=A0AAW1N070_POPJA